MRWEKDKNSDYSYVINNVGEIERFTAMSIHPQRGEYYLQSHFMRVDNEPLGAENLHEAISIAEEMFVEFLNYEAEFVADIKSALGRI